MAQILKTSRARDNWHSEEDVVACLFRHRVAYGTDWLIKMLPCVGCGARSTTRHQMEQNVTSLSVAGLSRVISGVPRKTRFPTLNSSKGLKLGVPNRVKVYVDRACLSPRKSFSGRGTSSLSTKMPIEEKP